MTSPLRLAVFDLDGTIVDSQANIVRAVQEACGLLKVDAPDIAAIPRVIGLSLGEALGQLFPALDDKGLAAMDQTYRDCFARFRQQPDYKEPLFEGTHALLDELEAEGILLGIATGKGMRGVTHILKHHGISGRFATIQTPDIAPGKPHPGMLQRAMAEADVTPDCTVMIGDTTFDMQMARAAGTFALGVAWGNHPVAELKAAGAHRLVDRLADLMHAVRSLIPSAQVA